MTQILNLTSMLLGGLAFFLYGMSVMSSGLEQMSNGSLERKAPKIVSNDFSGFLLGAGITAAIQSSSAVTVMIVSFVNSGVMDFYNTFGMIMGSNVGTTLTAWLLSLTGISSENFLLNLLKPITFAPILAFLGIILKMIAKSEKKQNLGVIFIGFAILMYGMELMSGSMLCVRSFDGFDAFLKTIKSPISALLISTVFTGIIQSSAATIGIVEVLTLSGGITYEMAIPLVLGANIGTCVTALISAVGTNRNAKRVVVMHFAVNVLGSAFFMIILYLLKLIGFGLLNTEITIYGVAAVHTLFNVLSTVIFLPFKKQLLNICEFVVPNLEQQTHFLNIIHNL